MAEVRACLALALPLAGAQLAQVATAFTDTVMMGLLGSQALAAGGLGATAFSQLLVMSIGMMSVIGALVAEAHGAGRPQEAGKIANQGLWLALVIAVPITILVWHMGPGLMWLGQSEANVQLATPYLRAIAWGFFPALGFAVLRNFVAALSQPRSVLVIVIGATGLNIVGNYILMFGWFGLPALGLAGMGWSSTLVYWSMFLVLAAYILSQPQLRTCGVLQQFRLDRQRFWTVLQMGWPVGVLSGVEAGLFVVTTFLMGLLGTVPLAAHHIALQTASITFMVPLGISYATTVRVGLKMGQGDRAGSRRAGYVGMGIGGVFMGLMALVFWVMPAAIVSIYLDLSDPSNREVVAMAVSLLGVAAMFQVFDGLQVIAAGALRGLKDTRIPMVLGILAYWGIGLSSGYGLGFLLDWGSVGLWWGLALGLAIAALVLSWRFSRLIAVKTTRLS